MVSADGSSLTVQREELLGLADAAKAYLPAETKRRSSAVEAAKAAYTSMGWFTDRHMAAIRLTR
jgi:hypothetical protein